eukprot:7091336-Alexandrium_andersonii.AAC.1
MPRLLLEPTDLWLMKELPDGSVGQVRVLIVGEEHATSRDFLLWVPLGMVVGLWVRGRGGWSAQ